MAHPRKPRSRKPAKPRAGMSTAALTPTPAAPPSAPPLADPTAGQLTDQTATLAWLRDIMCQFLEERQWHKYHLPRNLAASVSVEAGELLELFQWLTPEEAARRCREDKAFRRAVGEEMCDVMMYCVSLANAMNFDIASTIAAKMAKNRLKYPPEKFRGHYERPLQ